MASPNTLKIRQERHYTKAGLPTQLLLRTNLRKQRQAEWERRHGTAVQDKAVREIQTGVKDSRSATA